MNPIRNIKWLVVCFSILLISNPASAQSLKAKMKASKDKLATKMPTKDNSEAYECGYIHKTTLAEKANPMKALQKGLGGAVTDGNNNDLGAAAISVFYQAHLHPQNIMKYPTKIPGWETCGDAVFAGFTNKDGLGLSATDGEFKMDGIAIPPAGIGTYFQGFNPSERREKTIEITSSNGNKVNVKISPAAPLEIKTIDGKAKGEEIILDGTKDIVIELANGDADPQSRIHVQLIGKLMGTPIIFDITVTKAKNTIYIPKEAFKNFEGSPTPFVKMNTLIVNRVVETVIDGTDAGALRTISAYMDWAPVKIGGDLAKGNVITMGMDSTKNTNISIALETSGTYAFSGSKNGPYISPPVKLMKNVAIASFVVRGNMTATKTTAEGDWLITRQKWFPEYTDATWQELADKMYSDFEQKLENNFDLNVLPLADIVNSESYKHAKPILDGVDKNFVEIGAGGTKRVLVSSSEDFFKDLSITFGSDFISERLVKELGVDAVIAVTVDLNFNFENESLDPKFTIVAYAPMVSYKTSAQYFKMEANTIAKSLSESKQVSTNTTDLLYNMIKAEAFSNGFVDALKQLSKLEDEYPVYEKLWKAKM